MGREGVLEGSGMLNMGLLDVVVEVVLVVLVLLLLDFCLPFGSSVSGGRVNAARGCGFPYLAKLRRSSMASPSDARLVSSWRRRSRRGSMVRPAVMEGVSESEKGEMMVVEGDVVEEEVVVEEEEEEE